MFGKNYHLGALSLLAVIGACTQPLVTPQDESITTPTDISIASSECRNDGARLPLSGLCADTALKHLEIASGAAPLLPAECDWQVQETGFATDLLLYLAAKCDGVTSQLTYSAGARRAELVLSTSAIGSDVSGSTPLITVLGSDPATPLDNLERFTLDQIEDVSEKARCEVRPTNLDGWPVDAFVVDDPAAAPSEDGPRAACGPFGYDGGNAQYWRVFQDFSWFFNLGQDALQDIDPRSLTLLIQVDDGSWAYLEPLPAVVGEDGRSVIVNPAQFNARDRDACAVADGTYEIAGLLGHFRCTLAYSDAGQVCSDARDCEGRCLAGDGADFDPTGETSGQTGFCQANDNSFGCLSDVIDGRVQPGLCID